MVKLLVAVDGSKHSARAIDYVVKTRAQNPGGVEIDLLNVQHAMPFGGRVSSVIGSDKIDQYHREEGMAALKPAMQALDAAKLKYKHHIGIGDPAQIIVDYAKQMGTTEIVVGTHGAGAVSALVLGSVATKVVALSSVPVVLVK
jgi:nucleotide-binding universal stress UspA family protein